MDEYSKAVNAMFDKVKARNKATEDETLEYMFGENAHMAKGLVFVVLEDKEA